MKMSPDRSYLIEDQALSLDQQQKAERWLNKHWRNRVCPVHGGTPEWQIEAAMAGAPVLSSNSTLILGGPVFPYVVVLCPICGYSILINAVSAGVVSQFRDL